MQMLWCEELSIYRLTMPGDNQFLLTQEEMEKKFSGFGGMMTENLLNWAKMARENPNVVVDWIE